MKFMQHVPEGQRVLCKNCGKEVYWETSKKTGKNYLANLGGDSGTAAMPHQPHTAADCADYKSFREQNAMTREGVSLEEAKKIVSSNIEKVNATPKGFANKFPGKCVDCGNFVQKGEGLTSKPADKWELRCVTCHHG